jgi:hypothetical protein
MPMLQRQSMKKEVKEEAPHVFAGACVPPPAPAASALPKPAFPSLVRHRTPQVVPPMTNTKTNEDDGRAITSSDVRTEIRAQRKASGQQNQQQQMRVKMEGDAEGKRAHVRNHLAHRDGAAANATSAVPMDLTGSPDDVKLPAPSGPVPAPAAPRPRGFQRVLPRLKPQLNALEGWTQKTADVVIIGAGAAGLQCAERLSKSSPLLHPDGRRHHSLSVLVLEGRARLGGRIDTVPSPMPGSKIVLERGATFIHGCDHDKTNLAFNLAVRTGMHRQVKNDVSSRRQKKQMVLRA